MKCAIVNIYEEKKRSNLGVTLFVNLPVWGRYEEQILSTLRGLFSFFSSFVISRLNSSFIWSSCFVLSPIALRVHIKNSIQCQTCVHTQWVHLQTKSISNKVDFVWKWSIVPYILIDFVPISKDCSLPSSHSYHYGETVRCGMGWWCVWVWGVRDGGVGGGGHGGVPVPVLSGTWDITTNMLLWIWTSK